MESQTKLYIPANIKTRFEFFDGYGFAELVPTIIAAAVGGFAAFIVHAIAGGTTMPVLVVLVAVAGTVICLSKGVNNLSIVDQIRQLVRFSRGRKIYRYTKLNEWSDDK